MIEDCIEKIQDFGLARQTVRIIDEAAKPIKIDTPKVYRVKTSPSINDTKIDKISSGFNIEMSSQKAEKI